MRLLDKREVQHGLLRLWELGHLGNSVEAERSGGVVEG